MRYVNRNSQKQPAVYDYEEYERMQSEIQEFISLIEGNEEKLRPPHFPKFINQQEINQTLYALFDGKCAFCETALARGENVAVEQFRPSHSASDLKGNTSLLHYFWITNDWENLYPICKKCNSLKANHFPVKGSRAPIGTTIQEVKEYEKPRLLDPCNNDIHRHLDFTIDGMCHGITERGEITINVFQLNRSELIEKRADTLSEYINRIYASFQKSPEIPKPSSNHQGAVEIVLWNILKLVAQQTGLNRPVFGKKNQYLRFVKRTDLEILLREIDNFRTNHRSYAEVKLSASSHMRATSTLKMQSNTLRKVEIKNFRAIQNLSFEIAEYRRDVDKKTSVPCLTLLGENATGKSTVLEAISLALLGTSEINKLRLKPRKYINEKASLQEAEVHLHFYGSDKITQIFINPHTNSFQGTEETSVVVLAYGPRRYFTQKKSRRLTSPFARVKSLLSSNVEIPHPGPWLKSLDQKNFSAITRALREILMLDNDDNIFISKKTHEVEVRIDGVDTPLDQMSEGYKSLMALAVDIMRELLNHYDGLELAHGIVLIDEIEIHLHPRWKAQLMTCLRKALPKVQFIISTHDPLCTRGMDNGEVQVMYRDRKRKIDKLKELPNVQGFLYDQLLVSEFFGLDNLSDPALDDDLATYLSHLSQKENDDDHNLITDILKTALLGKGTDTQIEQDALEQYLNEKGKSFKERKIKRSKAVEQVLAVLKSSDKQSDLS